MNREEYLRRVEEFHRRKAIIEQKILSTVGRKEIIYGERALEVRLPEHLRRKTDDYDVYSPTPKKDAIQAEKELDKEFGGDYFRVEQAKHKGTWKVRSNINGKGYADFTKPKKKIPSETILNKRYITLKEERKARIRSLKRKEDAHRHSKDKDAINRIDIYKKRKRQMSAGMLKW